MLFLLTLCLLTVAFLVLPLFEYDTLLGGGGGGKGGDEKTQKNTPKVGSKW